MIVSKILEAKGAEIISLDVDSTVLDVAKLLGERRIGAILILSKGDLAGIISERDIMRGLAIRGGAVLADPVESLMTKSVFTCSSNDSVANLMEMMTSRRIRHIPVVDDGSLSGMISIGDVVKEQIEESKQEAAALKEYIGSA